MGSAKLMLWLHAVLTILFLIMIPVSLLTSLKDAVPYVVFLNLWSLVANHWTGWQTANGEIEIKKSK